MSSGLLDSPRCLEYQLPPERIASRPTSYRGRREDSLLLVASQWGDSPSEISICDAVFSDLPKYLQPGDLLVANNSRVIPARFFPQLQQREVEVVLLQEEGPESNGRQVWKALSKPMRRFHDGEEFELSSSLRATVLGRSGQGRFLRLELRVEDGTIAGRIDAEGQMPIPPYIRNGRADDDDKRCYQTIFASSAGSVAAPTAGLHLSEAVLSNLAVRGIEVATCTLHVGPQSFLSATAVLSEAAEMPGEIYCVAAELKRKIALCRERGGRVIAVGTTSVRALESGALLANWQCFEEASEDVSHLCIQPGFQFRVIDGLITNFHQPETTHLLLVAAVLGDQNVCNVYQHALGGSYRFLSYGDAMLLLPKALRSDSSAASTQERS